MSDISILDLQNLRHLIGGYETTHCKIRRRMRRLKNFFRMQRILQ